MMVRKIDVRKSETRGKMDHGWLQSHPSFSFAEYYDPNYMGHSVMRVLNEDIIAPGTGFGMHPHRDMEIVTYMLSGQLRHQDTMGNVSVIRAGDVQRMTAGSGLMHSELNASTEEPVHLLQIWIHPDTRGLTPSYEEIHVPVHEKLNQWRLIVSPKAGLGQLAIHQDVKLYASCLHENHTLSLETLAGRTAYVQIAQGEVLVGEQIVRAGDALIIGPEEQLEFVASDRAELVWFDLPEADGR